MASLVVWLSVMTLLLMVEFILLQAVAVGITTVIYSLIPDLDAGKPPSFEDWRRIFQVVSPTVTVSGGAGIVLSSILFARQAQVERQNAEAAREAALAEAEAKIRAAQAEVTAAQAMAEAAQAKAEAAQANERAAVAEAELLRMRLAQLENGKE